MYAAVFESDFINSYNKLKDLFDVDTSPNFLGVTSSIKNCAGSAAVHDIQLSELPEKSFNLISEPSLVFRYRTSSSAINEEFKRTVENFFFSCSFDWSGKIPLEKLETKFYDLRAKYSGRMHGVFMWWDLIMDPDGKIILSCAPEWAPSTSEKYAWRDHWMQAIYYFRKNPSISENEKFTLIANHDEFSLWFDVDVDSK